ncbi:MAG: hypothetical protein KDA97_15505, partial [Acidimicrobiales bacterium]|nr:hypothetical protein [Acidimicrobiales bacterium]
VLVAIGAGGTRPLAAVLGKDGPQSGDGGHRRPEGRLARALVAELDAGAATLDGLVRASGRPLAEVAAAVSGLEANGTIVRRGAWFEASQGPAAGRAGIGKP